MRKRIPPAAAIAALLVLLALLSPAVNGPVAAQTVATVRPEPAALELAAGEIRTVEIRLENARDVYGIDVRGAFDPAIVEVVDADPAVAGAQMVPGAFPQPDFIALNTTDNAAGTLRYVVTQVNPTTPATGTGIVFSFQMRGRAGGATDLAITLVEMSDRDGNLLAVTTGSATITVTGSATEPIGIPLPPTSAPPGDTGEAATIAALSPTLSAPSPATTAPQATILPGQAGGATPIATATTTGANASVPATPATLPETASPTVGEMGADPAPATTLATGESAVPAAIGEALAGEPAAASGGDLPISAAPTDEIAANPANTPQVIGGVASSDSAVDASPSTPGGAGNRSTIVMIIGGLAVLGLAGFLLVGMRKRG